MILENFKIDLNQETIYSCKHVLIHEFLSNFNYRTELEILDIINLEVVPTIQYENGKLKKINLPTMYKNKDYYDIFGMDLDIIQHNGFEKGWSFIEENINNGRPVIVSGTQYHLNYTKMYHSSKYFNEYGKGIYGICNHWIMVLGYYDDKVYVRDPSYKFLGIIPIEDFKKFWEGDRQFKDEISIQDKLYRFGYINIKVNKNINSVVLPNINLMSIKRYLDVFLKGEVPYMNNVYIGRYAYSILMKVLDEKECDGDLLNIYNFLHLQKYNVKIVNNALCSAFSNKDNTRLINVLTELDNCFYLMEEMCMKLYMCLLRKKYDNKSKKNIIEDLKKIYDVLTRNYAILLKEEEFSG